MTDETSARFGLPLLAAGQAQKEVTHNEALALLDLLVQPVVEAVGVDVPPAAPVEGQAWIVGDAPEGLWRRHPGALAGWMTGGWRFVAPREGVQVRTIEGMLAVRRGDGWQRGAAIAPPAGGAVVDAEARATLAAILAALRTHGLVAPPA